MVYFFGAHRTAQLYLLCDNSDIKERKPVERMGTIFTFVACCYKKLYLQKYDCYSEYTKMRNFKS